MNAAQLPLKDIHLPQAVGCWPPAPGWWLLALLIALTVALLFWLYKFLTRKTAVKAAKKMLLDIQQNNRRTDFEKLCAISELLRRTAISCYPRSKTAALTGSDWLQFLDSTLQDRPFSEGPGKILIDAPYMRHAGDSLPMDDLIRLCREWLDSIPRNRR